MDSVKELKRLLKNSREKATEAANLADQRRSKIFELESENAKIRKLLTPFAEAIIGAEEVHGMLKVNRTPDSYHFSDNHLAVLRHRPLLNEWIAATKAIFPKWPER